MNVINKKIEIQRRMKKAINKHLKEGLFGNAFWIENIQINYYPGILKPMMRIKGYDKEIQRAFCVEECLMFAGINFTFFSKYDLKKSIDSTIGFLRTYYENKDRQLEVKLKHITALDDKQKDNKRSTKIKNDVG